MALSMGAGKWSRDPIMLMHKDLNNEDLHRAERSPDHSLLLIALFFLLCLTWMYNGAWLGLGRLYLPQVPGIPGTFSFVVLSLLIMLLPERQWQATSIMNNTDSRKPLALLALVLAVYLFQYHFGSGNPALADPMLFIIGSGLAFLAWASWLFHRHNMGSLLFLLLWTFIAVQDFRVIPLSDLWHGSQLNLVWDAAQSLLSGNNPYLTNTINYFPMLWIPYVPFVGLNLDPRILNVILIPIITVILFGSANRLFLPTRAYNYNLAICGIVMLTLNPGVVQEVMKDQVPPDWLYQTLFTIGLVLEMAPIAALGIGLSAAARQTTLVLLPLALFVFTNRFPRGLIWFYSAVLFAVGAVLPFLMVDPRAFLNATFGFNQRWFLEQWATSHQQATAISLVAPFFLTGMEFLLQPLQIAVVLAITSVYAFKKANNAVILLTGFCLIYFTFLLLNPIIWDYYWITFMLMLLVLIITKILKSNDHKLNAKGV